MFLDVASACAYVFALVPGHIADFLLSVWYLDVFVWQLESKHQITQLTFAVILVGIFPTLQLSCAPSSAAISPSSWPHPSSELGAGKNPQNFHP